MMEQPDLPKRRPRGAIRYIYFIRDPATPNAPVKIGSSDEPRKRLKNLRWRCRADLHIIGAIRCTALAANVLEVAIHWRFRTSRVFPYGAEKEWFKFSPRVRRFMTAQAVPLDQVEQHPIRDVSEKTREFYKPFVEGWLGTGPIFQYELDRPVFFNEPASPPG